MAATGEDCIGIAGATLSCMAIAGAAYEISKKKVKPGAHVKWNWNKTETKLKQNIRWRSTKLFCFSLISAARTCETECWNKLKSWRGLQAGLAVDLIVGLAATCLPARLRGGSKAGEPIAPVLFKGLIQA